MIAINLQIQSYYQSVESIVTEKDLESYSIIKTKNKPTRSSYTSHSVKRLPAVLKEVLFSFKKYC